MLIDFLLELISSCTPEEFANFLSYLRLPLTQHTHSQQILYYLRVSRRKTTCRSIASYSFLCGFGFAVLSVLYVNSIFSVTRIPLRNDMISNVRWASFLPNSSSTTVGVSVKMNWSHCGKYIYGCSCGECNWYTLLIEHRFVEPVAPAMFVINCSPAYLIHY